VQAEGSDAPQVFNKASSQLSSLDSRTKLSRRRTLLNTIFRCGQSLSMRRRWSASCEPCTLRRSVLEGRPRVAALLAGHRESKDMHLQPAVTLPRTVALSDTAQVRVWCLQCDACILIFKIRPSSRRFRLLRLSGRRARWVFRAPSQFEPPLLPSTSGIFSRRAPLLPELCWLLRQVSSNT